MSYRCKGKKANVFAVGGGGSIKYKHTEAVQALIVRKKKKDFDSPSQIKVADLRLQLPSLIAFHYENGGCVS